MPGTFVCSTPKSEDAFIGRVDFGRYSEKCAVVTTFQDEVYVHLKDRSKGGRGITLRGCDYLQLLKQRGQVTTLIEQGGKHLARKRHVEDELLAHNDTLLLEDDNNDLSIEDVIRKVNQRGSRGKNPKGRGKAASAISKACVSSDSDGSESPPPKETTSKRKKRRKRHSSTSSSSSDSDDEDVNTSSKLKKDQENVSTKQKKEKKKPLAESHASNIEDVDK